MANRAYFVNHTEKTPVSLDNQRGNWLLAASYQIPVLGLAMFSDADCAELAWRVFLRNSSRMGRAFFAGLP
jgi:hypothetical protein